MSLTYTEPGNVRDGIELAMPDLAKLEDSVIWSELDNAIISGQNTAGEV